MAHLANRMEHRWGERIRVNIPVHVPAGSVAGIGGSIKNLSLSGALIKSDCELRLHSLIDVHIEVPGSSQRVDIVKAHVARKLEKYVGIEWCEFAPAVVKDLLRSLSLRLPA